LKDKRDKKSSFSALLNYKDYYSAVRNQHRHEYLPGVLSGICKSIAYFI